MHIRYSALALAVTAALSTCAFARAANANPSIKAQTPAGFSHGRPHFKYPNHPKPTSGSVLYDQTGIAENGVPFQDFQSSLDAFDSEAADDFVVTDAAGWSVSAFNFQVEFDDSVGTPTAPPATALYNIDVYADTANAPGTLSCSYTGITGTVDATNTNLTIALPSICALAQGAYWLSMTPIFDLPPQAFWSNASGAAIGNAGVWRNPSGGFGTACSAWSELSTCITSSSFVIGAGNPNYLFQVIGAVGSSGGCNPGQLCLVSTVGTDTSPGACGMSDVIDATVGDQLNFCYTITNNTGIELDFHALQNNVNGTLFNDMNHPLAAGATYQVNDLETVGTTNSYNSTWTAQDIRSGYAAAVESGGGNCADRIFADGFENSMPVCVGDNFVDVTGTGSALGLSDDGSTDVAMPFSFNFYGTSSNQLCVANNGFVGFNTSSCSAYSGFFFDNGLLPDGFFFSSVILPLWDDFGAESGEVYTDTRGISPNRQFIVEWFNRVHYDGNFNTDGATFELILNEDGTMQFEYADVAYTALNNGTNDPDDCTDGVCATIGLQNTTTLFNPYSALQPSVTNNSGIKWSPAAPQIFTASDTVTVSVGAPQIVVNPNTLGGSVIAGATSALPFAIENHGDRDLNWTLGEAAASNFHFPPPGTRFAIPLGDPAKASSARAPLSASAKARKPSSTRAPLIGVAVPTFAVDLFQNIETFDALAPQTVSIVAPSSDGTAYVGGAFIGGDYSKLYAITGNFGNNPDDLFTIDTATGAPSLIGSAANAPGEAYTGLAYDSTSGVLYAATADCALGTSHLWTIDPATATPAGVGVIAGAPCIVAIAINAQGEMYGFDVGTDALYAIDKTNGNAALIGSIGFNANYAQDMAFDVSTGVLYLAGFDADALTDSIYTLDLQTGAANIIGPIGASLAEVDAMSIETVAGPCMQPQDLPWLSLNPIAGMTSPLGTTPVNASIDGTGSVAGDTLSGTVCVTSNDPVNRTVATPITVNVMGAPLFPPGLSKMFNPATVQAGVASALTIGLDNTMNGTDISLTAPLIDAFPTGLVVAAIPNASSTCGGNVTAVPGSDSVTFDGAGAVIPGLGACFLTVDVVAAASGSYANDIPADALQTTAGNNMFSADATLQVELAPPTITKDFNPLSVAVNTPSTLTITLGNANASADTLSTPLIDAFPTGVVVAAAPNASTTCGGAITAVAGSDSATLDAAGAQIPANGSCTIEVDVESAAAGTYSNDIPVDALQTSAGSNGSPADADLVVTP